MDYDIAIIGAGPAGLSFALSLRDSGLKVAIIEKQPADTLQAPAYDGRKERRDIATKEKQNQKDLTKMGETYPNDKEITSNQR